MFHEFSIRSLDQDLFRADMVFAGADDDLSKPSVAADETCINWAGKDKPCRSGMPTLGAHGAHGGRLRADKDGQMFQV